MKKYEGKTKDGRRTMHQKQAQRTSDKNKNLRNLWIINGEQHGNFLD